MHGLTRVTAGHRGAVAWLCAGLLASPGPAEAADGTPVVVVLEHPTRLQGGDAAEVVARVDHVAACRLRLDVDRGGALTSSLAEPAGRADVTWRWHVPSRTGRSAWHGAVECWQTRDPIASGASVAAPFSGSLAGDRRPAVLVGDEAIAVAVTPREGDQRPGKEQGADWAQILTAVLGIPGLVLILLSLRAARRQMRSERTSRVLDRYNTNDFLVIWATVMEFLKADDERACVANVRRWEARKAADRTLLGGDEPPPDVPDDVLLRVLSSGISRLVGDDEGERQALSKSEVQSTANFYEEIGALFNAEEIDQKLVGRAFGQTVVQAFEASWWWIHYSRDGRSVPVRPQHVRAHENEDYAEWERMVRSVVRRRPEIPRQPLNKKGRDDTVRAICLPPFAPPDEPQAPADQWAACQALSEAIGDVLRAGGIEHLKNALATHVADDARLDETVPARTMLVPTWREHVVAPRLPARQVARLGATLDGRHGDRGPAGHLRPEWLRRCGRRMARIDRRVAYHERHQAVARALHHLRTERTDAEVEALVRAIPPPAAN
jgi:hypothetical protein